MCLLYPPPKNLKIYFHLHILGKNRVVKDLRLTPKIDLSGVQNERLCGSMGSAAVYLQCLEVTAITLTTPAVYAVLQKGSFLLKYGRFLKQKYGG